MRGPAMAPGRGIGIGRRTMAQPLMPKATAVWLVDNTALTFDQIAEFCNLHTLEVKGIADGEVAVGIQGQDPIAASQLTREEIARCENDPSARLKLSHAQTREPVRRSKGPRYTPLSKRQERPNAIAWLVRYHPELPDSQITKLVGTTKPTIEAIRERSHWNISNITPQDPVTLGMCTQTELDAAVRKAQAKLQRQQEREERERAKKRAESIAAADEAGMPSVQQDEADVSVLAPEPPAAPVEESEPEPAEKKESSVASVFGEQAPKQETDTSEEVSRPEDLFKN
jgi:hypothetical protein